MVLLSPQCLLKLITQGTACRALDRMRICQSWRSPLHSIFNRSRAVHVSPSEGLRGLKARTSIIIRSFGLGLCGLGGGGVLLCAIPCLPVNSKDKPAAGGTGSLQGSAASLSHHKLIKNAAAITVDSSCILLTHCALSAIALHQEYAKMVNKLKLLLEDHAQFVGPPSLEDELWQDIIRQRVEIDDQFQAIEDASVMLTSAILVVERAAEAAYQADAELSAMTAGQHLQLVQAQLETARKVSQKAQEQLTNIQIQTIKGTGDSHDGNSEEVRS